MTKIHPNASAPLTPPPSISAAAAAGPPAILTVWRKSLLLNCSGFTVFDAKGNLVYRVDNYASAPRAEIVLMDSAGEPLLTIRRKKLSFGEQWLIYEGEGAPAPAAAPRFAVRRHVIQIHCGALAHVTPCGGGGGGEGYAVEGSYSRRSCAVYDERRRRVAEIKKKETVAGGVAFGGDVFRLVVEPGCVDAAVVMAIVIVLEQMFGSRSSR